MTPIAKHNIENLASMLKVKVSHFAKGSYPIHYDGALPVNRFFTVLRNPDYDENYISDKTDHYTLQEGITYCIPCYHHSLIHLNKNLKFISVQSNIELFDGVDLFSRTKKIFTMENPSQFSRIKEIYDSEDELISSIQLKAYIHELSVYFLELTDRKSLEFVSTFGAYKKIIDYIQKNCHAGVKVEDLAEIMNTCRETFTRKFTNDTGISPKQFFNQFLLQKACHLLRIPGETVKEVAFKLDFSSEYYFSRFFKQHTGIPPSTYQKRSRFNT